jgi:DNA-binding response OmpR family regulator
VTVPCVLVIDDDPNIRELYTALLHDEGYRVETAVDGQDGLNRLSCAPDLILLDLMMPVMDGHQFLERLRNTAKHQHTPVVVLSAVYAGATLEGAQAVMQKPFEMDALLGRVSGLLALAHRRKSQLLGVAEAT